jgi:DNA polymerase II small subunit/DNA polymerase delta subunit B
MEKAEILRKFLEKGLQLDYESLDFFSRNTNQINNFFDKIPPNEKPTIISLNYIHDLLKDQNEEIEMLKSSKTSKNTLTVDEMMKILNNRYTFLKKILSSRLDLINPISLNKITPKTRHFSTIIMVKEKIKEEKAIIVEDETGEKKFFFENEDDFNQILLDDIIGVVCDLNERIKVKTVIWPDIQMKRAINKTAVDINVAIISNKYDEKLKENILKTRTEINHMIFVDNEGEITYSNKTETNALSPSTLKMEKNIIFLVTGSNFLIKYPEFSNNEDSFLISLLKRRNIDPTFELKDGFFETDPYLIETIPDIFVVAGTKKNLSANYKGTTIITVSNFEENKKFWIINLKSRETINVSLG